VKNRAEKLLLLTVVAVACLGAMALAGFPVYSNGFDTRADVLEMSRLIVPGTGTHCKRTLSGGKMHVTVGKGTTECDYSPPVVAASDSDGGNFDISAKVTLASDSKLKKKTFLSVGLRVQNTGAGAGKYRLDVSPEAQRFALRRYEGAEKASEVPAGRIFAQGKRGFIKKSGKPNKIRLKVFNVGSSATLIAKINGKVVATLTDVAPLDGRRTLIAIGRATGSARGAMGSFDDLVIRTAP
jgi:hypothetical protein